LKWAKEKLSAEEINNFLLATDREGNNIISLAARNDKLDILQ